MTSSIPNPFAVETTALCKRYGTRAAVEDLTLRIPAGVVFGFIGPNGAGKSTTIKMLMGLIRKSAGSARVLGFDVDERAEGMRQNIGYVPEVHNIYPWMSVGEVIGFCRSLYDNWDGSLCAELEKLFGLERDSKVRTLSKGTLAKLGLLVALSHQPDLLLLDEPTAGLDPLIREEFLDGVLRGICKRPQTVLLSSHTLSDVQRLADMIGIIDEGKLLICASAEDLMRSTKRVRAVLAEGGAAGEPPVGTVWQRSQQREWLLTVHGFSPDTISYLHGRYPIGHLEVFDLTLEEIFKDFIKGRRKAA